MKKKLLGKLAVKSAEGKLFICHTVWPFDLVPDTIKVEEDKVTVIHRDFFLKDIITVHVKDLLNVEVVAGPIFATAKINSKYVTGGHKDVHWLLKKDALKLRDMTTKLIEEKAEDGGSGGQ